MVINLEISEIKYRIDYPGEVCPKEFNSYAWADEPQVADAGNDLIDVAGHEPQAAQIIDISVTADDIAWEKKYSQEEDPGVDYGDASYAKTALLRKIALESLKHSRALVHGACIEYEGQGFLFTAPSGTGKTTHIKLWRKHLGENVSVVNGDKPIIEVRKRCDNTKKTDVSSRNSEFEGCHGNIIAYGTPWAGKEGFQTNTSVPLCAIIEIKRGTENSICQVKKADAFAHLYSHSFITNIEGYQAKQLLELLNQIVMQVPYYALTCDMSDEAFACSFEKLTGKSAAKICKIDRECAESAEIETAQSRDVMENGGGWK